MASNKLDIVVHPALFDATDVQTLRGKGHNVICHGSVDLATADLVIGPNCWRMTPELLPYLDLAVKAARKTKKEKAA